MKKKLLLLLTLIITINSYSQITFDKGYYINNNGQKIDCLIKNIDWDNTPTEFEYKLTADSNKKKNSLKTVKEFGVYGYSKYIRSKVQIDRSTLDLDNIKYDKNPVFKEEVLFLKVLIEGKSNLYSYIDGSLKRFFFTNKKLEIKQLIYKIYQTKNTNLAKNKHYQKQLWDNLKCPSITMNNVLDVEYKKNDLVDFFTTYNKCTNEAYSVYNETKKRNLFNLTLRPRLRNSSFDLNKNTKIDLGANFGFGVELEYVLPFNKNKWALIIEPTYHSIKSSKIIGTTLINTTYNLIEIPLGVRHSFFLNNNSKIFINGSFIIDINSKSSIHINTLDFDISARNSFAFGVGYNYKNKYSIELRNLTNGELLNKYQSFSANYNAFSIIFGYTLF